MAKSEKPKNSRGTVKIKIMSKFQFIPEEGATPMDYLLEEEKKELQNNNVHVLASYTTFEYYFKSINDDKYLSVNNKGWLKMNSEKFKWKAFCKESSIDDGHFILKAKKDDYKDYYIGHKTASILARVYYFWTASDWLELTKKGTIINNDLDDRTLAKHTNGHLYWINRKEARSGSYTILYFKKEIAQ